MVEVSLNLINLLLFSPGIARVETQHKLFTYAQAPMANVPPGTPIILGMLAYYQTGWLNSFNT